MDTKKEENRWFGRKAWARYGLLMAAVAVILLVMPRADHQSYSFELNQPWKYPLLTAEFDMPVLRDSTAAREMRDSINANFIPFVKRRDDVAERNEKRLHAALADSVPAADVALLSRLLDEVYNRGVTESSLSTLISRMKTGRVRAADPSDPTVILSQDASGLLSAGDAFNYIDSAFNASHQMAQGALTPFMARALYASIDPNVVLDTVTDDKFRSQELLEVTAALGVIKKGQRIVDRGEIINSQVFTNLTTYMTMLEENETQTMTQTYYTIGRGIIVALILVCLYVMLWHYRRTFYESIHQMIFLMTYITFFVVFAVLMFEFVANGLWLVPFAAVPVVVMIFFDSRTAIFALLVSVLITSLVATFPHQFIILELLAGIFATASITQLTRRSQLLMTALITFIVYVVAYSGMQLIREGTFVAIDYRSFGYFAVNSVILSFAYVLIFLMEKIFGFTSNVTLVELSDINNSLLRKLAEEAPGTFQHSVQVSTLAAEAARAIGANTLLVRTGALYHDIGKLDSPVFFTENQHGVNPHSGLDPETSARKIISHVSSGVTLAKANKLPKVIRDFIREHHGCGVTKYFYNTAVNERGEENVDKSKFQYPGPNPLSRETAILMMADAVEAASRSLKDYSPESISNLVNRIVDSQVADGMFKEAPISFRDIETIKQTFIKRLRTIYHTRIAYPELKKQAAASNPAPPSAPAQ
ncbi:MAG: HDIG domain-containing protein [Muribaculaceae bacterium]|nr:HDIG domain-containing protein [Muribaculaceae bacterium]